MQCNVMQCMIYIYTYIYAETVRVLEISCALAVPGWIRKTCHFVFQQSSDIWFLSTFYILLIWKWAKSHGNPPLADVEWFPHAKTIGICHKSGKFGLILSLTPPANTRFFCDFLYLIIYIYIHISLAMKSYFYLDLDPQSTPNTGTNTNFRDGLGRQS